MTSEQNYKHLIRVLIKSTHRNIIKVVFLPSEVRKLINFNQLNLYLIHNPRLDFERKFYVGIICNLSFKFWIKIYFNILFDYI